MPWRLLLLLLLLLVLMLLLLLLLLLLLRLPARCIVVSDLLTSVWILLSNGVAPAVGLCRLVGEWGCRSITRGC